MQIHAPRIAGILSLSLSLLVGVACNQIGHEPSEPAPDPDAALLQTGGAGDSESQFALGNFYAAGPAEDLGEARRGYALAAEQGVPVVMQAGASGGRSASECGRPIGIDRPAIYFAGAGGADGVDFVLSHTGWPWVEEALAMVGKHPNVFLGTAAFPPHHWSPELLRFVAGAGKGKVMLGTSFPVVGHRHALARLADLDLNDETRALLLEGTARRVFTRLDRSDHLTQEESP